MKRIINDLLDSFIDNPVTFFFNMTLLLVSVFLFVLVLSFVFGINELETQVQVTIRHRDELVQECLRLETYTREECILMVGQGD